MPINIRQKGANAEREVADMMNDTINEELAKVNLPRPLKPLVQRNQNQSAVGGSDLTNPFSIAIEVKRQEALSINTWWKQTEVAAKEFGGVPVLVYRQSRQPWKCIMYAELRVGPNVVLSGVRVELSWEDFKSWFRARVSHAIQNGWAAP